MTSGSDDYGRNKPDTVDFFHGASAGFDNFRQDKILLEGANGASENGRGTYFTDSRQQADAWSGRSGGKDFVVLRISIEAGTAQNSFIPHERIFSKEELINLAVHASLAGHFRTADNFANLAKHDNPSTGKDIANRSKYDPAVNEVLAAQGYKGFTYSEENYKKEKIGNIVFFDTNDVPLTIPVLTTTYTAVMKQAEGAEAKDIPPSLKAGVEKLQKVLGEKGQVLGMAADKIAAAQENIGLLAQAAVAMAEYDTSKTIHPLKHAEVAIIVATNTQDLARAVRKEMEEFVTGGMHALGHAPKPLVFEAQQPAAITDPKEDSRYKDDRTTQLYHQYLQDPKFKIASEELRSGRYDILQKDPGAQKQLDNIIMHLHSPALGGNDGFSMRNSFGVGLKDLARGDITPQELVQKMDKAAYFANVDMKQYFGNNTFSKAIEDLAERVARAPAAVTAAPVAKPQMAR